MDLRHVDACMTPVPMKTTKYIKLQIQDGKIHFKSKAGESQLAINYLFSQSLDCLCVSSLSIFVSTTECHCFNQITFSGKDTEI